MCVIKYKAGLDSKYTVLVTLVIAAFILFIRKTDSLLNPQFWAEDGTIFFSQQYKYGATVLLRDYSGYLNLVPRTIALIADTFFPYAVIPTVYVYTSLLLTLLIVASLFSQRLVVKYKPLMALTIVLVPHYTNEVFLNITNLQWILALLLIVVLFKEPPNHRYGSLVAQYSIDLTTIIICGFTGPFIVFLMPFYGWRWVRDRNTYHFLTFVVIVIISFIQLSFITAKFPYSQNIFTDVNTYSAFIGHKLFGNFFLSPSVAYQINHFILTVLYLSFILFILYLAGPQNRFVLMSIGIHFITLAAVFYKFKAQLGIQIPPENAVRYTYIPYIMLVWSLIALLDQKERWKTVLLKGALVLVVISAFTSRFHSPPLIDYHWGLYSQWIGKKAIVIPINPKGWKINLT